MGHQSYVLLCTETTLSNPPVVQPKSSCDVHLLRSPWPKPPLVSKLLFNICSEQNPLIFFLSYNWICIKIVKYSSVWQHTGCPRKIAWRAKVHWIVWWLLRKCTLQKQVFTQNRLKMMMACKISSKSFAFNSSKIKLNLVNCKQNTITISKVNM